MKLFFLMALLTSTCKGMDYSSLKLKHVWKKEAIERTLKSGQDPEILSDKNGKTLLHYAASKDREGSLISFLCTGYPTLLNRLDNDGHTPLHYAAFHGNYKGVECLLAAGCNPNAANHCGKTALHKAVQLGDTPTHYLQHIKVILNLLIGAQANANQQDYAGNTFLHDAAMRANATLYNELAKFPVNKKQQNKYKYTAIHLLSIAESQSRADHFLQCIQKKSQPLPQLQCNKGQQAQNKRYYAKSGGNFGFRPSKQFKMMMNGGHFKNSLFPAFIDKNLQDY